MTYLETVALIRSVALEVNPSGEFIHGTRVDGSLQYDKPNPLILLEPFTINIDTVSNNDTTNISLGFMFKDSASSSVEEREVIIGNADELCSEFITEIQTRSVDIQNVRATPFYRVFAGVLSGYLLTFNLVSRRSAC